jgi:hypothetical protein
MNKMMVIMMLNLPMPNGNHGQVSDTIGVYDSAYAVELTRRINEDPRVMLAPTNRRGTVITIPAPAKKQ